MQARLALTLSLLLSMPGASALAEPAATAGSKPLVSAERARTINQFADALAAMYVQPAIGARYAATLRSNLARGAYKVLTEQKAFADNVTADLQAISPDVHLRLLPNEVVQHPPEPDGPGRVGLLEGIEDMRMIGSVAYLRFNAFPHNPRAAPAARSFLLKHADAQR